MNLGRLFKEHLELQGKTIAWLADKLRMNEKTLAGKLSRNSITGEEVLLISYLLGIDVVDLQKQCYIEHFDTGGNFMNANKLVETITRLKTNGIDITNKQKGYIDNWYEVNGGLKYLYDKNKEEVFIWCDSNTFSQLAGCEFYLDEENSSLFVKMDDEVIVGFTGYESSIRFIELLEQVQNDESIDENGNHIEEE